MLRRPHRRTGPGRSIPRSHWPDSSRWSPKRSQDCRKIVEQLNRHPAVWKATIAPAAGAAGQDQGQDQTQAKARAAGRHHFAEL